MGGMVEAEQNTIVSERRPQRPSEKLFIWATKALSRDCREISEKMGCDVGTVVDKMLYVGDGTMKAFAGGDKRVIVSLVSGKIVIESFKD